MARSSSNKSGASRIRFVMLEADIQEGDLAQITHAIQNALRPSSPNVPQRLIGNGAAAPSPDDSQEEQDLTSDFVEVDSTAPKRRAGKPRVAKVPNVLNDIDFKADPSLESFVSNFELKTDVDRYLVITLWFRDARGVDAVTVDHIYTAFRVLTWSTSSRDFSKPLRNLRDEQSLQGGAREGFSLTLVGAGKIEKKKKVA